MIAEKLFCLLREADLKNFMLITEPASVHLLVCSSFSPATDLLLMATHHPEFGFLHQEEEPAQLSGLFCQI